MVGDYSKIINNKLEISAENKNFQHFFALKNNFLIIISSFYLFGYIIVEGSAKRGGLG